MVLATVASLPVVHEEINVNDSLNRPVSESIEAGIVHNGNAWGLEHRHIEEKYPAEERPTGISTAVRLLEEAALTGIAG